MSNKFEEGFNAEQQFVVGNEFDVQLCVEFNGALVAKLIRKRAIVQSAKHTLSLICRYIQCPFLDRNCSTTVRALGHCCDICGAVMTFASNKFTVNDISEVVRDVVEDINLNGLIQYSIERIDTEDDDEVVPRYQIVGFPMNSYDETVFATFTLALHYKLTSLRENLMEYFSAEYKWSELDHSYSTGNGYFILKEDKMSQKTKKDVEQTKAASVCEWTFYLCSAFKGSSFVGCL
ncbi:unnamed protein product [Angiostrongylus costaricensis]|uniref:Protein amnionless n=1 Tax=Angiostrongylus costaricensis TaxID=334426 RepID=A0A0R3PC63_ANGCS|nr:unnamed protein product [Angiostrongylus costaricensis]